MTLKWKSIKNFSLEELTRQANITPSALIRIVGQMMKSDPDFAEFIKDGDYRMGSDFYYFVEDTQGMDVDQQTERADELLERLYDFADDERIAL